MGQVADGNALDAAMQRTQQGKRLSEWINSNIASESARDEARALRMLRAQNARPSLTDLAQPRSDGRRVGAKRIEQKNGPLQGKRKKEVRADRHPLDNGPLI